VISATMGSLLIRLIISRCVNLVNIFGSFDKSTESGHRHARSDNFLVDRACRGDGYQYRIIYPFFHWQWYTTQLPSTKIRYPNSVIMYTSVSIDMQPRNHVHPHSAKNQSTTKQHTFFLRFFFRSSVPDNTSRSVSSLRRF
jgi:hypothetical protein